MIRKSVEFALLLSFLVFLTRTAASGQQPSVDWRSNDLPFGVANITSNGALLWVCGSDETIAVSSDNAVNWKIKNQTPDGGLLLNIEFVDLKFGYATGTGGLFLTTVDGGETWMSHPGMSETILQASFADRQHGLIRTPASLLFTVDGGSRWSPVSVEQNSQIFRQFPYTFSLVALDALHMGVMLKQGTAQYYSSALLFTGDSGKSWGLVSIPSTTLYSFLRVSGRYSAVGTEVINKDRPGGGYAVPVALFSSDGEKWDHGTGDLSACKLEGCTLCNTAGCLSSNGVISRIFLEKTRYSAFPASDRLTPKWAATSSTICFVGSKLQCAGLKDIAEVTNSSASPVPTAVAPSPLGSPITSGPHCIVCGFDRIFVDSRAKGAYTVKLVITIAKDGTVANIESEGAPTDDVKSRIEGQVQQWIFEPYLTDGKPVNVRLRTSISISVIKPR